MRDIPEKDWKKCRAMKDELLNIACEKILKELETVIKQKNKSHKNYLKIWMILNEEDDKLGKMFDDIKRSNAVYKLAAWKRHRLVTDEELAQFSDETQEIIRFLNRN